LKLLLVAESLEVDRGGQERSLVEYCRELCDRGVSVAVLAGGDVPPPGGCAFLPIRNEDARSRVGRFRSFLRQAESLIRDQRRERLVQTTVPLRGAHVYLPRSGLCPEVFTRSRLSRPSSAGRWMAAAGACFDRRRRLLLSREAEILLDPKGPILVALSDYVARTAKDLYGLGPPRVRVIRNGVDVRRLRAVTLGRRKARAALGIEDGTTVFLAAAHNFRLKGIPELVGAARHLPASPPWKILVAGRGAPVRGAPGQVHFLGEVADLQGLWRAADVLVHPTFTDPSSRVVLEALALGLPVITTKWNGAADFVGAAGIVLDDPRDLEGLAGAMRKFLDPLMRAEAAAATLGKGAMVSMGRHAAEMIALFEDLRR
jgi:UDP-glucose:(heptosyl)LPS alpha-1,3-glucosyltransferase